MRLPHWIILGLVLVFGAAIGVEVGIYKGIRRQAEMNEARPADAIVVFGAAEYNGTPSPVFKARLDHALDLEERGLAPLVITTGGSGGDAHFTEGGVGRDYLIQMGVAAEKILSETHSETTFEAVKAVTRLLKQHRQNTCIAVSDGFHLYRVKRMLRSQGIIAYASPAPESPIEAERFQRVLHSLREMVVTSLWFVGFRG